MEEQFKIDSVEPKASAEPFDDAWEGNPFVDEDRKLNLNKLLHLAPYSELLLVSGVPGVGKSSLLRQFVSVADNIWKVVHAPSGSLVTAEEFLTNIVNGFDLPADDSDDIEGLLTEISRYLQALGRSGRRAIIVVDDFHQLSPDVGSLLERVLNDNQAHQAMSVILAVDASQQRVLDKCAGLRKRLAYTLRLEPMAEESVADYVRHRLKLSGQQDDMINFPDTVLSQIYQKSAGLPSTVNELARKQLAKSSGRPIATEAKSGGVLRTGLIVLAVAAVGLVLVFQDKINQLVQAPGVESVADEKGDNAAQNQILLASSPVEPEPAPTKSEKRIGELMPVVAAPEASNEAAAVEAEPVVVPEPAKEAEVKAPEPVEEVQPVVVEIEKPTAPPQPKAAPVAKKPEPVVAPPSWMMSQDAKHYTLQLMALKDEAKVRRFVKTHKLGKESEVFYIQRKAGILTTLIYGSYTSKEEAQKAAKSLPKRWGVGEPWVRSFGSVHKDVYQKP